MNSARNHVVIAGNNYIYAAVLEANNVGAYADPLR